MEFGRIQFTKPASFRHLLGLFSTALLKRRKIYDYTDLEPGTDYVFEAIGQGNTGHMIGCGKGITPGDRLILSQAGENVEYQVEEINYYANPSMMWTALLTKISPVKDAQ